MGPACKSQPSTIDIGASTLLLRPSILLLRFASSFYDMHTPRSLLLLLLFLTLTMLCSSLSFCFRSQTLCSVHRVHATRVLSTTSEGSDTPTFFEPLLPKNFTGFSNLPPTRSYTLPPDVTTGDGALPFPKSLSPSSALEFNKCPQSYLLRYILNYKDPQTPVMLKGAAGAAASED